MQNREPYMQKIIGNRYTKTKASFEKSLCLFLYQLGKKGKSLKTCLNISGLGMQFKGVKAVQNVSMNLEEGKLYALIGTNGAGKTTIINMISGVLKPTAGTICFQETDITGMRPDRIAKMGVTRTYQNLRLFKKMTVLDNVLMGAQMHSTCGAWESVFQTSRFRENEKSMREHARRMLDIMGIAAFEKELAGSLPYGNQRKLEIARILASNPKLLLLDEPAAGMNPQESHELVDIIRGIQKEFGLTILLIEHDMKVVMNLCEYIYCMAAGEVIAEGGPEAIRNNPRVIEAYLGKRASHVTN